MIRIYKECLISEKNTGQKYKYEVEFFLNNKEVIKIYFFSEHLYESITYIIENGYIQKDKEFYILKSNGKEVLIDRKNIILINMQKFENK